MKKVAIIGCAPGWEEAPETGERWGITNIILQRDLTRMFDIHDLNWTVQGWYDHFMLWLPEFYGPQQLLVRATEREKQVKSVLKRVKKLKIPLYSTAKYKGVPTSKIYPFKKISEHFQCRFFTSSIDYAFVMALFEEYEQVDFYGIKMTFGSEYAHQLRSFHYWLGLARGMGVTVNIHGKDVSVLKTKNGMIYGYNEEM